MSREEVRTLIVQLKNNLLFPNMVLKRDEIAILKSKIDTCSLCTQ